MLGSSFVRHIRLHASGRQDAESLLTAFAESTFFCRAPKHPGFLAVATSQGPLIAAYTSEISLARHAGACRWFTATGGDLVSLAPVRHRFIVDPGSQHQLVVDPAVFLDRVSGPAA